MPLFEKLYFWQDTERSGPENMAVDEWLWQNSRDAVLRVYGWHGSWSSLGYFGHAAEVPAGLDFVRRPTGGGYVDHRHDWTYSVIIPRGHELAEVSAADSYLAIHRALAVFLRNRGVECRLQDQLPQMAGGECFQRPVQHDLLDGNGMKIAGAGQRRGRVALLHQGSVLLRDHTVSLSGQELAAVLSNKWQELKKHPRAAECREICESRYESREWNYRR